MILSFAGLGTTPRSLSARALRGCIEVPEAPLGQRYCVIHFFGGKDSAYFTPTSIRFPNAASVAKAFGPTRIQPFIGLPVISKGRVCGCDRAFSPSSGDMRTIISLP